MDSLNTSSVISPEMPLANNSNYSGPQVWADYLDKFQWDLYGHLSFRGNPHPESADKLWDVAIHRLNRYCYGQHYWKNKQKGLIWAKANEFQKRGTIHF